LCDEPWHSVLRTIQGGNCDQGILRRARSACIWLRVARETLVGVEAGTEPVVRAFGPTSTPANLACPSWKNAVSSAVRPFSGVPAPARPPRTPGSTGAELV
jgi:hypothetical protein